MVSAISRHRAADLRSPNRASSSARSCASCDAVAPSRPRISRAISSTLILSARRNTKLDMLASVARSLLVVNDCPARGGGAEGGAGIRWGGRWVPYATELTDTRLAPLRRGFSFEPGGV